MYITPNITSIAIVIASPKPLPFTHRVCTCLNAWLGRVQLDTYWLSDGLCRLIVIDFDVGIPFFL
jgi:hypothetical protein